MKTEPNKQTALDKVIDWTGQRLSLCFIFIVIITFYEVVMRYLFNSPTIWVHETATYLGGALFVFGGAYALATDKHVRVVLIYDNVSEKTKAYFNIFHHVMGILFSGVMVWASYQDVIGSWTDASTGKLKLEHTGSYWNTPFIAYLKAIVLITMIILVIQFTLRLIAEIRAIAGGDYA